MGTEKFWFCVFSYNVALMLFLPRIGSVYMFSLECRWTFDCGNETTCLSKLGHQRQCNRYPVLLATHLWGPRPTCKKSEVALLWGSSSRGMKPQVPVLANVATWSPADSQIWEWRCLQKNPDTRCWLISDLSIPELRPRHSGASRPHRCCVFSSFLTQESASLTKGLL